MAHHAGLEMGTSTRDPGDKWLSIHFRMRDPLFSPATDRFLLHCVEPFADAASAAATRDWFFVRYGQRAPHLRIRLPRLGGRLSASSLKTGLAHLHRDPEVARHLIGIVYEPYAPEVRRYGGKCVMKASEHLFCRSTAFSLGHLHALEGSAQRENRRWGIAIATCFAFASVFSPEDPSGYLSAYAAGYEARFLPDGLLPKYEEDMLFSSANRAKAAASIWARMRGALGEAIDDDPFVVFVNDLRALRAAFEEVPETLLTRDAKVVSWSHLHMTMNRIGLSPIDEMFLARIAVSGCGLEELSIAESD